MVGRAARGEPWPWHWSMASFLLLLVVVVAAVVVAEECCFQFTFSLADAALAAQD